MRASSERALTSKKPEQTPHREDNIIRFFSLKFSDESNKWIRAASVTNWTCGMAVHFGLQRIELEQVFGGKKSLEKKFQRMIGKAKVESRKTECEGDGLPETNFFPTPIQEN